MTTEEILEGKRLIADFMGEQKYGSLYYIPQHGELKTERYSTDYDWVEHFTIEEMKYDISFDWIHPVAVKIFEKMECKMIDECTDFENNLFRIIGDMNLRTPIEEVFGICAEYVKWYNEQNK